MERKERLRIVRRGLRFALSGCQDGFSHAFVARALVPAVSRLVSTHIDRHDALLGKSVGTSAGAAGTSARATSSQWTGLAE